MRSNIREWYLVGPAGIAGPFTRGAAEAQQSAAGRYTLNTPTLVNESALAPCDRARAKPDYDPEQ